MSRSVSATFSAAVNAQETAEVFLLLLEISHADIGPPTSLYFVNNRTDIVSGANTYTGFPFQISLPADVDNTLPSVQLSIDNVDRSIIAEIRGLSGPPTITLKVVLADTPNVIEAGPFSFSLRRVDYDAFTITGTLLTEDILNEPYPGDSFTPQNFPGLFT